MSSILLQPVSDSVMNRGVFKINKRHITKTSRYSEGLWM